MMRGSEREVAAEPCSTGCERMKGPCGPDFTDALKTDVRQSYIVPRV